MSRVFDFKKFLDSRKNSQEKEEWLFAIAVVKAGLEHEGNLDDVAEKELTEALEEFDISPEELGSYLKKNRRELLRFLHSYSG